MSSAIVMDVPADRGPYGEQAYRLAVGRRIQQERFRVNIRQEELATRAQVSRNFVSSIERGQHGLDAWRLRKIAVALGHDINWLLEGPVAPGR